MEDPPNLRTTIRWARPSSYQSSLGFWRAKDFCWSVHNISLYVELIGKLPVAWLGLSCWSMPVAEIISCVMEGCCRLYLSNLNAWIWKHVGVEEDWGSSNPHPSSQELWGSGRYVYGSRALALAWDETYLSFQTSLIASVHTDDSTLTPLHSGTTIAKMLPFGRSMSIQ